MTMRGLASSMALPRLCCRGLIEAGLSTETAYTEVTSLPRLCCRGLIEAGRGRRKAPQRSGLFRGFVAAASLKRLRRHDVLERLLGVLSSAALLPRPH